MRPLEFASNAIALALVLMTFYWLVIVIAKADEPIDAKTVQQVADRVGLVLQLHGFTEVRTDWQLPPARIVDLTNGHAAETDGTEIRIDIDVPKGCRFPLLAHEITHLLIAKYYGARPDAEGLANAVQAVIDPDATNC